RGLKDLLNMGLIERPARGFYAPAPADPVFEGSASHDTSRDADAKAQEIPRDLPDEAPAITPIPELTPALDPTAASAPALGQAPALSSSAPSQRRRFPRVTTETVERICEVGWLEISLDNSHPFTETYQRGLT